MNKDEVAMIGFEVVAFAGEARSQLMMALDEASKGEFEKADELVFKANASLIEAHKSQTKMIGVEGQGEDLELGFIMVHAQDHLMTTMLLKDTMKHLFNIYKQK